MADRHDLRDHLRGCLGDAGAWAPELADEGGREYPLKHCRTLIEAESEASQDTKEAQAHLDHNVLARYAAVAEVSILGLSGSPSAGSTGVAWKQLQEHASIFALD